MKWREAVVEMGCIFDRLAVSEDIRRNIYWDKAVEFWGVQA